MDTEQPADDSADKPETDSLDKAEPKAKNDAVFEQGASNADDGKSLLSDVSPPDSDLNPEPPIVLADNPQVTAEKHQTVYKILEDAMASPQGADGRAYVHPVLFDCLLAFGLLIAMGGFTIGLLKIYITHSAQQSMNQRNYKAAIGILRGAPFPGWFTVKGKDPQELLNQAIYLEAMDKLDANKEDQSAINELTQIEPGSKFFEVAQEVVKVHTHASDVQLEGRTEHEANSKDPVVEDNMPVLPPEPKE